MQSHYRIGDIASKTGLSQDTLRYYEKQGLICAKTRSASNYRLYDEDAVQQAHFIQRAKAAGFSLTDIRNLLKANNERGTRSCQDVKDFTRQKLEEIDQKIIQLKNMRETLSELYESCHGGPAAATECNILESLSHGQSEGDKQ